MFPTAKRANKNACLHACVCVCVCLCVSVCECMFIGRLDGQIKMLQGTNGCMVCILGSNMRKGGLSTCALNGVSTDTHTHGHKFIPTR